MRSLMVDISFFRSEKRKTKEKMLSRSSVRAVVSATRAASSSALVGHRATLRNGPRSRFFSSSSSSGDGKDSQYRLKKRYGGGAAASTAATAAIFFASCAVLVSAATYFYPNMPATVRSFVSQAWGTPVVGTKTSPDGGINASSGADAFNPTPVVNATPAEVIPEMAAPAKDIFSQTPTIVTWSKNAEDIKKKLAAIGAPSLRDLAISESGGAVVDEKGNVSVWTAEIDGLRDIKGKDIVQVQCISQGKVYALSKNGTVYEIPLPSTADETIKPTVIPLSSAVSRERIRKIAASSDSLVALTESGKLLQVASNSPSGSQGTKGNQIKENGGANVAFQTFWDFPNKISDVVAGRSHFLAVSEKGKAFGWGSNQWGQLGIEYDGRKHVIGNPIEVPLDLNGDKCVSKIAAGGYNSYFVVDSAGSSELFAAGKGDVGQLGNNNWSHMSQRPVRVKLPQFSQWDESTKTTKPVRIKSVVTNGETSAAVLDTFYPVTTASSSSSSSKPSEMGATGDDVYAWGNNSMRLLDCKSQKVAIPDRPKQLNGKEGELKLMWNANQRMNLVAGPSIVIAYKKS